MDCQRKIKELRKMTGMNRREFCSYFEIPYRTVTEWEMDNRHAPEYLLRLLEYYIRTEKIKRLPKGTSAFMREKIEELRNEGGQEQL